MVGNVVSDVCVEEIATACVSLGDQLYDKREEWKERY